MPKAGFKSITLSESVYDRFQEVYEQSKDELALKGIKSFSGYVTCKLEEMMQEDKLLAKHAPMIEPVSVEADCIILKDKLKGRIAEVAIQRGKVFCQLCEDDDCSHIGFAFSIPKARAALSAKGIKIPR